jgi:hypothetical protein
VPAISPPRDLWARTSAALDREVARHPEPLSATVPARRRRSATLTLGALTSLGVVVAVVSTQLQSGPGPVTAGPTPFSVPPTVLAVVDQDAAGLTLYRTRVDRFCPEPLLECTDLAGGSGTAAYRLSTNASPNDMAIDPRGNNVAITASEKGSDVYAVFRLDPQEEPRPVRSPAGPAGSTAPPRATDSTTTASPSPVRASPDLSTRPPSDPPAPPTATEPVAPATTVAATPTRPGPTNVISPPPLPTADATLRAIEPTPILSGVIGAGMPAAWSADGSTLAFSAMPADRSTGPDIYTWRPGERQATPLTDDHASYFASWSGTRIVISRTESSKDKPAGEGAKVDVQSHVIDPATGDTRRVGEGLWLPVVDPTSTLVIFWQGRLEAADRGAEAMQGDLYLASWSQLDPFAKRSGPSTEDPDDTPAPRPLTPPPAPTEPPFRDVIDLGTGQTFKPGTVRDWELSWAADGGAYGLWLADKPAATTGTLTVVDVESAGREQDDEVILVGPTPARRAFSLGLDRVAWVAPVAAEGDGELRVMTWGPGGRGSVRLRDVDAEDGVPAF